MAVCSHCGSTEYLAKLRTCTMEGEKKPGYIYCTVCHGKTAWHLQDGQKPLFANNRLK